VYKQEFNCNLVGYCEAVEKTLDLFRPVVTCAVLFCVFVALYLLALQLAFVLLRQQYVSNY
jgi:hypothetical protein